MKTLFFLFTSFLLSSCFYQGYFQSPFHGVALPYKSVPMSSEGKKSVQYAGGGAFNGGANYQLRDVISGAWAHYYSSFQPSENIQLYAGANTMFGSYRIRNLANSPNGVNLDVDFINRHSGSNFFGGLGASGGLYFVVPFAKTSEWRVLELETSWLHEFGSYLDFRMNLPAGGASIIDRKENFGVISFGSEIVSKVKDGNISYKTNVAVKLGRLDYYNDGVNPPSSVWPAVFSQTLQIAKQELGFFVTLNTGFKTVSGQVGLNYRLDH